MLTAAAAILVRQQAEAAACNYSGEFFKGSLYATRPASKLQSIPVYDQGEHSWCWAYTAAQAIDACLLREGLAGNNARLTSPIFFPIKLAAAYDEGHVTGNLLKAWKDISPRCRADRESIKLALMRAILNDGVGIGLDGKGVKEDLDASSIKLNGLHSDRLLHRSIEKLLLLNETVKDLGYETQAGKDKLFSVCGAFVKMSYRTDSEDELDNLIGVCLWSLKLQHWDFGLKGVSVKEAISVSAEPHLRDATQLICLSDSGKCIPQTHTTKDLFESEIDDKLKDGIPVGIDYCAKILGQGSKASGSLLKSGNDACGYHASLIIGRREQNGTKQYLIKNSWGTGCSSGQYGDNACQCGHVWAGARALLDNIGQISWIR